jgi:hypothetical protein
MWAATASDIRGRWLHSGSRLPMQSFQFTMWFSPLLSPSEHRTRYAIYPFRIVVNLFFRFPVIMRLTVATYSEHGRWFSARAR